MATEIAERLMSAEEFLEWESQQEFRHELIDNRIYPMPGGSSSHEDIIAALVSWFFLAFRGRVDHVYAGIQVMVDALATYTYPDVTVVIGEPAFHHGAKSGPLENPSLSVRSLVAFYREDRPHPENGAIPANPVA